MAPTSLLALTTCVLVSLLSAHVAQSQPATETAALLAFSKSADTLDKTLATNWTGDNPCFWIGVSCSRKRRSNISFITGLDLKSMGLVGTIAPELANLANLTSLVLYNNSLTGSIPPALAAGLPSLDFLSLGLNQLDGTIPPTLPALPKLSWLILNDNQFSGPIPSLDGAPQLTNIFLARNRLTGPIPAFTSTLPQLFTIDYSMNQIEGPIPPGIDRLTSLENLFLFGNRLTGPLPLDLTQSPSLKNLDLRQNNLSGPIPMELASNTLLISLDLSQNLFSGEIPPALGNLVNLTDLRLSENNLAGTIPPQLFVSLPKLTVLNLARNNLTGTIPSEIGALTALEKLDMGNNNLTGALPPGLAELPNLTYLYLATNRLTGPIPPELGSLAKPFMFDLSDNYLNGSVPAPLASANFSVALNCIGLSASNFFQRGQRDSQACAGLYPDVNCSCVPPSVVGTNGSCYCVSPLRSQVVFTCADFQSIGNFSSKLASVMGDLAKVPAVSDDQVAPVNFTTSRSPCSVLFTFDVLPLNGTTLGDGTAVAIKDNLKSPDKAATVKVPFFNQGYLFVSSEELRLPSEKVPPPPTGADSKIAAWTIAVISSASALFVVGIIAILVLLLLKWRSRPKRTVIPGTSVKSWKFSQLQEATKGFNEDDIIGRGGFGIVFKGRLDGSDVAVKRLEQGSNQGHDELAKEVETIGSIHHRNLVCLEGYCIEGDEYLLVYNLMTNGSLEDWLFKAPEKGRLTWPQCVNIIKGTADALAYLHVGCKEKIIHRDIKPANILLDDKFEAHVADFGLARTTVSAATHVSTRVMGTMGYLAPEYAHTGQLTEKSDVYSFGMVILVILSHREAVDLKREDGNVGLVSQVVKALKENRLLDLISPHFVNDTFDEKEATKMIHVAIMCIQRSWQARPSMDQVRQVLHNNVEISDAELTEAMSLLRHDESVRWDFDISSLSSILASSIDSSIPGNSNISKDTITSND